MPLGIIVWATHILYFIPTIILRPFYIDMLQKQINEIKRRRDLTSWYTHKTGTLAHVIYQISVRFYKTFPQIRADKIWQTDKPCLYCRQICATEALNLTYNWQTCSSRSLFMSPAISYICWIVNQFCLNPKVMSLYSKNSILYPTDTFCKLGFDCYLIRHRELTYTIYELVKIHKKTKI